LRIRETIEHLQNFSGKEVAYTARVPKPGGVIYAESDSDLSRRGRLSTSGWLHKNLPEHGFSRRHDREDSCLPAPEQPRGRWRP